MVSTRTSKISSFRVLTPELTKTSHLLGASLRYTKNTLCHLSMIHNTLKRSPKHNHLRCSQLKEDIQTFHKLLNLLKLDGNAIIEISGQGIEVCLLLNNCHGALIQMIKLVQHMVSQTERNKSL